MKANKWIVLAVILLVVLVLLMKQRTDRAEPGPSGAEETVAQTETSSPEEDAVALLPSDQETVADTAESAPSPAPTTPRATAPSTPAQGERSGSSSLSRKPVAPSKTSPPPKQAEESPQAPTGSAAASATSGTATTSTAAEQTEEPAAPAEPRREKPLSGAKLAECLASGRPTLAEFGAGWCRLCKMMEPVIEQAAAKYKGKAHVVYVDVSDYGQVARQHGIRPIPTQIFFGSDGKEASRHIGYYPLTDIDRELAALGVGR